MGALPTVRIADGDGYLIINQSDFDPTVHALYGEDAPAPAPVSQEDAPAADESQEDAAPAADESVSMEIDITDSARELAEEHGIDLSGITGSGSGGRIIKRDVDEYIEANG